MREIKFRAFNKKTKKMRDVILIDWKDKYVEVKELLSDRQKRMSLSSESRLVWLFKDIKLMQYTGSKDKNGKEIYEGDIVKGMGWDDEYHYGEIKEINELGYYPDCWLGNMPGSECWEVIGNIYENPELLKEEL